jgi:hypothetical protein
MNFLSASNKGAGWEENFEIDGKNASWTILNIPSFGTISKNPIS